MAEETWTFETLRAALCFKVEALEKLVDERFRGSDRFHATVLNEKIGRLEQRFILNDKALDVALQTGRDALAKAETASIAGFEKSNEWRASLNDVMQTRLARSEFDTEHKSLADKVDALSSRLDTYQGARPVADRGNWRDILSVISILISLVAALAAAAALFHHM